MKLLYVRYYFRLVKISDSSDKYFLESYLSLVKAELMETSEKDFPVILRRGFISAAMKNISK